MTFGYDFPTGKRVQFTTTGTLPTGLAWDTNYWTVRVSATACQVATSLANALAGITIGFTDSGVGYHELVPLGPNLPQAPVFLSTPQILGVAALGQVLTCTNGTPSNDPACTYQWKRGGVDIVGETAKTHTIVVADVGTTLTCQVTATNAYGSASKLSAGRAI